VDMDDDSQNALGEFAMVSCNIINLGYGTS
jgi:hypothetical protein